MVSIGLWEIYKANLDPIKVFNDVETASEMHGIVRKYFLFVVIVNM